MGESEDLPGPCLTQTPSREEVVRVKVMTFIPRLSLLKAGGFCFIRTRNREAEVQSEKII